MIQESRQATRSEVFEIENAVLHLETVSGDITTHTFSACDYTLRSVSGDITVYVAPGLEIDVDGKSLSGETGLEISLGSSAREAEENAETATINAKTVSGDIKIARN